MKIYKNVLSDKTLSIIHSDFDKSKHDLGWSAGNLLNWKEALTRNISGTVVFKPVPNNIAILIQEELSNILPERNQLGLHYNIWHPNSGISWHDDGIYTYGFTLYLNEDWDLNWGGLFMWEDNESDEYKMFPPEYNTLILNDNREYHAVSIISPTVTNYRLTIQGFAK